MLTNGTNQVDPHAKGFPPEATGQSLADLAVAHLHDYFSTPIATLRADALANNLQVMADWCARHKVEIQPHGKTTMAPALFHRQLEHGATGITAATAGQVRFMRSVGVPSVQLASQLIQPREADWLAADLASDPGFMFLSWVDSPHGVAVLDAAGKRHGVTFDVLLEVGLPGGRTGCRTEADRAAVLKAAADSRHVRVRGVSGYEGAYAGDRTPESMATIEGYLNAVRKAADEIATDRPVILTAGGSVHFDLVANVLGAGWPSGTEARVIVRSGCYITHDHGIYSQLSPLAEQLRPALTVWGTVISRPEPDLALLDVGRRDVGFDQGFPIPQRRRPADGAAGEPLAAEVFALNDQHAFVRLSPDKRLDVGDRVELGISHPCTTFDKWRHIPVVDADGVVTEVVNTYF